MTSTVHSVFKSRRDFGRGFLEFSLWFAEQNAPTSEDVWGAFLERLAPSFALLSEAIWRTALHPAQRDQVATLFCAAAHAKMQLDPSGNFAFDPIEGQLWNAALSASPRAVANWEAALFERYGEFGLSFSSVKHRLADLYKRAGRSDSLAVRLYIEVFTGRRALPTSRLGAGSQHSVDLLLERGCAISPHTVPSDMAERYSLCLLLQLRGFRAPWVSRSLEVARQKFPQTRQRLQSRFDETMVRELKKQQEELLVKLVRIFEIRASHLAAQSPVIAQLAQVLNQRASHQTAIEWEERCQQQELKLTLSVVEVSDPQIDVSTPLELPYESEVPPVKPKRKRGRPRKNPITEEPLVPSLPLEMEVQPNRPWNDQALWDDPSSRAPESWSDLPFDIDEGNNP